MRLFLLPVSTRRTFMYAQRLAATTSNATSTPAAAADGKTASKDSSVVDKGTAWAAKKWAQWEKKEAGWQRKVVDLGNHAFRRIPYEEWGLKSVPPLSRRRADGELKTKDKIELLFPGTVIEPHRAEQLALKLATERQGIHRSKMMWCFVGMPITLPFALVPVIPNLPFFYLVYRAWSHWRAVAGGKHVQWLVENKLLRPSPSAMLDRLYAPKVTASSPPAEPSGKEELLLSQEQIRDFSDTLAVPALELELERAVWQVERALKEGDQDRGATTPPS
ncbi:hypothetical protein RJ55_08223 [Drechmeria coniospora]|nr:hypothetical protein RJ55_08223 [Drechmeria coniospora]